MHAFLDEENVYTDLFIRLNSVKTHLEMHSNMSACALRKRDFLQLLALKYDFKHN